MIDSENVSGLPGLASDVRPEGETLPAVESVTESVSETPARRPREAGRPRLPPVPNLPQGKRARSNRPSPAALHDPVPVRPGAPKLLLP